MFHLHPTAFGIGPEDPSEGRERMHRVALHEARIATEHRNGTHDDLALADQQRSFRLQLAGLGGRKAELDACCA